VLMEPAEPRHAGMDFPVLVSSLFRVLISSSNGRQDVALGFVDDSLMPAEKVHLARI
jgi:hypothetical protein